MSKLINQLRQVKRRRNTSPGHHNCVPYSQAQLAHAARELDRKNQTPADDLVDRAHIDHEECVVRAIAAHGSPWSW